MPEQTPQETAPGWFAESFSEFMKQPHILGRYALTATCTGATDLLGEIFRVDGIDRLMVSTVVAGVAFIGTGIHGRWYDARHPQSHPGQQAEF